MTADLEWMCSAVCAGVEGFAVYLPSPRPSRNGGATRSWVGIPAAA